MLKTRSLLALAANPGERGLPIATFTGYRKARAAMSKLAAGQHKQTYRVEQGG